MKGIFITFEGLDASGKTTQIGLLKRWLGEKKFDFILTREPGGTAIRDKSNVDMAYMTEALLYAASRAQLVGEVILPALRRGSIVISDRFLDSSIAYQSFGRGLGDMVSQINEPAVAGVRPDLTFLLRTDPAGMRSRRAAEEEDRMDAQQTAFHEEVLRGYLALAEKEPERIVVIDGERPAEVIAGEIRRRVSEVLEK